MGCFADIDESTVEDIMLVNALHPMYLAKALLNQLLSRSKKSAIVVTSSIFGQRPTGGACIVYSATKSLARFLAIGLSYELDGKVDVLSWDCGEVATKMTKKKAGCLTLSPDGAAKGIFKDIGCERVSNGAAAHDFLNRLV
jgi:short-subunit dehydrogenase